MELPEAEKSELTLGYLPLTDAAPLIVADALGYFDDLGLYVVLSQEVSWANIRDKLATGTLDGAQMLSPLPAMTTLGVSGLRVPLLSGLVLSRNGNAITLSHDLSRGEGLGMRAAELDRPLTFGVVHGFSMHNLLLRRWLRNEGLNPDHDVVTIVVPPAQMVDSLSTGVIDGFCVGEPWNSVAVSQGVGRIVATSVDIWQDAPEKVFAVAESWHEQYPITHLRIRIALLRALQWLADMETNLLECVDLLSRPAYLGLPKEVLLPALSGRLQTGPDEARTVPEFHLFDPAGGARPNMEFQRQMIDECMNLVGTTIEDRVLDGVAAQTSRVDLFEQSLNAFETADTFV